MQSRADEPSAGAPHPHRPGRSARGRDLRLAIASGVALAVLFLGTLFVHPLAAVTLFFVLGGVALLELDVAFRGRDLRPVTPVALGLSVVLLYGTYASGPRAQALSLVLLLFATMTWILVDTSGRWATGAAGVAGTFGATCLMTLWVPFLLSYASLLLRLANGAWYLLAAVVFAVVQDIGAFAFGSRFGRHKLAPTVSPGKTWEGFAGGIATVLLVAAVVVAQLPGFSLTTALLFGVAVGVAAVIGDLAESMVKRDLGVKDLGRIVPGHGGIMDRGDAIVFALPTAYLFILVLGI